MIDPTNKESIRDHQKMINPNNKETPNPKLFNGNTNYGTLAPYDLNERMDTKSKNFKDSMQKYIASTQTDRDLNGSNNVVEAVNHPKHYQGQGGIECIDAIAAAGHAEGFCVGNCLKYMWRYNLKHGEEDLKKAQFYLNWYIDYLQKNKLDNK